MAKIQLSELDKKINEKNKKEREQEEREKNIKKRGKKILDRGQFIKAYNLYAVDRKINQTDFGLLIGLSAPSVKKLLVEFLEKGYIPGDRFHNGVPVVSDWYTKKEEEYSRMREVFYKNAKKEGMNLLDALQARLESAYISAQNSREKKVMEGLKQAVYIVEEMREDGIHSESVENDKAH